MGLLRDVRELLMPRVCPVCGHLMTDCEDVVCAFCAIGLPRYINANPNLNDNDKAAIEREQSQTGLSFAECEQARPQVNENEFRALKARLGAKASKNEDQDENQNEDQNERFWDNVLLRAVWSKADVRRGTTLMVYNHDSPYHRLVVAIKFMDKRELAVKLGRWAAMEADRLVWKSIPPKAKTTVPIMVINRYNMIKVVTAEMSFSSLLCPSIRTYSYLLGLTNDLNISEVPFIAIQTRSILMPPDVDPEHPHTRAPMSKMPLQSGGQRLVSVVANPVVVVMEHI